MARHLVIGNGKILVEFGPKLLYPRYLLSVCRPAQPCRGPILPFRHLVRRRSSLGWRIRNGNSSSGYIEDSLVTNVIARNERLAVGAPSE